MPESFGARLRQRRERQDIALATIAEQTKIKLSLLEALERDDVSHWPSGIFRRAFIRAYAHAIGLDPDVVVREFLEVYPDPVEVVAAEPRLAPAADEARRPRAADPASISRRLGHWFAFPAPPSPRGRGTRSSEHAPGHAPSRPSPRLPGVGAVPSRTIRPLDDADRGGRRLRWRPQPAPAEPDLLAAARLCTELGRVETRERRATAAAGGRQNPRCDRPHRLGLGSAGRRTEARAGPRVLRQGARAVTEGRARHRQRHGGRVSIGSNVRGQRQRSRQRRAGGSLDDADGVCRGPRHRAAARQRTGESVRALATIFAAQLAQLTGGGQPAAAEPQADLVFAPLGNFAPSMFFATERH